MKKLLVLIITALIGLTALGVYMKAAVLGEVRSLNPYFINSSAERQLIGYLYETLMTTSEGKAIGMLQTLGKSTLKSCTSFFISKTGFSTMEAR